MSAGWAFGPGTPMAVSPVWYGSGAVVRMGRGRLLTAALLGWLGLLVVGASAALAGPRAEAAPAIAPFTTAHLRVSGTVSASGQELPVEGEGEIDAARGASHLTVGLLGATFETIVVDGRTYSRNALTGRWEYTEGPQANGFNPARFAPYDPATIRAAGRNFVRIGEAPIGGVPTTHWRADADLARLLGLAPGAGFATSAATMDLWIGQADNWLRRLAVAAQGTTTDAGGATVPFKQALTLTFDHLDEPIAIAAPPGAVPAATPVATPAGRVATPGGALAGLPIAGATPVAAVQAAAPTGAQANVSPSPVSKPVSAASTALILRVVAAISMLTLAGAGLLAYRQRQARGL